MTFINYLTSSVFNIDVDDLRLLCGLHLLHSTVRTYNSSTTTPGWLDYLLPKAMKEGLKDCQLFNDNSVQR